MAVEGGLKLLGAKVPLGLLLVSKNINCLH